MQVINLLSRIIGKKTKAASASLPRVDNELPHELRVGESWITIPRASIAILERSLIRPLQQADLEVASVGRLKFIDDVQGLPIYRFYGPSEEGRAGQSFVQMIGPQSQPVETIYYQFLARTYPQTAGDQELYIGKGYGLGERQFFLEADLLAQANYSATEIERLLGGETSFTFDRDAPTDVDYLAPYIAMEIRIDDPYGVKGVRQSHSFMPYIRTLGDGTRERLLITFNVVESRDGLPATEVFVDFHIGLALNPLSLKFH